MTHHFELASDDWAVLRLAELRAQGVDAKLRVRLSDDRTRVIEVMVVLPGGITESRKVDEDPVRRALDASSARADCVSPPLFVGPPRSR